MAGKENLHIGHRERLRERFIREGIEHFEDHNILELVLFYAIPQKDTNNLAHELLNRFGSLDNVFSAQPEELMQVRGVGKHTALFLHLFSDLTEMYINDRKQNDIIQGIENITEFAVRKLALSENESLVLFFIDNKQSLLSWHYFQEGTVTPESIDKRTLFHKLMGTNTTHIMIAHVFPKSKAAISKTDRVIATKLTEALGTIGVGILEYIVIGKNRTYVTLSAFSGRSRR